MQVSDSSQPPSFSSTADYIYLPFDLLSGYTSHLSTNYTSIRDNVSGELPPSISPIFAVVSESIRPRLNLLIARAAAVMAKIPCSFQSLPFIFAQKEIILGAGAHKLRGSVIVRCKCHLAFILLKSDFFNAFAIKPPPQV